MNKEENKNQRYLGFGLSLLFVSTDRLIVGCNDCGDMKESGSELFATNWDTSAGHDGSTLTHEKRAYLPCEDGNYRITMDMPSIGKWEYIIDAAGNSTREQIAKY
jgi:hypothetical protein